MAAAADAFVCHHALAHDPCGRALFAGAAPASLFAARREQTWVGDAAGAVQLAQSLIDAMTPAARAHHGDFDDEVAYLTFKYGVDGRGLDALAETLTGPCPRKAALARQLFEDRLMLPLRLRHGSRDQTGPEHGRVEQQPPSRRPRSRIGQDRQFGQALTQVRRAAVGVLDAEPQA